MSARPSLVSPWLFVRSKSDKGLMKGLILSNAIGFAILAQFTLNFIKIEVPFTPLIELPIRIIALWLILDRTWRLGPVRLSFWDLCFIGFILFSTVGVLVNSLDPSLFVYFEDHRSMLGLMFSSYLYFLVVREACNRVGFRPDIMLGWFYAAMSWSAILGLLQSFELANVNSWSLKLYSPQDVTFFADKAYGTAAHFNALAFEMLIATGIAFSPVFRRKPKWWELAIGLLFLAAFVATESRGGLVAFMAAGIGTVVYFFWNGRQRVALLILITVSLAILVWGMIVFALRLERFTRVIEGEAVQTNAYLGTFRYRLEKGWELAQVGMKSPLFGAGKTNIALGASQRMAFVSTSSVGGTLDMMYPRIFAEFGFVGLLFILGTIGYLLSFIRRPLASRPFAYSAFICGVIYMVHGLAEYLIFSRGMMMVGIVAALASQPWFVSERGRLVQRTVSGSDYWDKDPDDGRA